MPPTLRWRHLGGMGMAAISAAVAASIAGVVIDGTSPAVFPVALVIAGLHVGLFAMPVFRLAIALHWRITLPRVVLAAFVIGTLPVSLIVQIPAWWAGIYGLCGGLGFWRVVESVHAGRGK